MTANEAAPAARIPALLRRAGLRPTRQRVALAGLILDGGDRHLTAEALHAEARAAGIRVSGATVYNCLHRFVAAGLLRELVIAPGRVCFDTNTRPHHHFYDEENGALADIPADSVAFAALPAPPDARRIHRVDVVVRLKK